MPSFFIAATSSTSTPTPSLLRPDVAPRELPRIEHVGRFVDEIARQHDAVGDRRSCAPMPFPPRPDWHRQSSLRPCPAVPRHPCAWSCSDRTCRRAAARRAPDRQPDSPLSAPEPNSAKIVASGGGSRHLSHGDAAELDDIARFQLAFLADPDHHQPRQIETRMARRYRGRAALAGKAVRRRRPADQVTERRKRLLACRAEFQIFSAEHNKNTAWAGERCEAELEDGGHGSSFSAGSRRRDWYGSRLMNRTGRSCKAAVCAKFTGRSPPRFIRRVD